MKKTGFILIFLVALLCSCNTKNVEKKQPNDVVVQNLESKQLDFSDPARMAGSDFGSFFISMLRTQNYDMALKFTSKESIEKFGVDKILNKYRDFKYNYKLEQKSINKSGNTFVVTYVTNEFATGKLKSLTLKLENDTCKLVLPDNLDELLK